MSAKKRKRPPVKGKNYQSINDLRVFGFILAILVIFTLAGVIFYTRVIDPTGKPVLGILTENKDDKTQEPEGIGDENQEEGDNSDVGTSGKSGTGTDYSYDSTKAPDAMSPQEYIEEVENKIKENNRQAPDKYEESFEEYEKKLNEMELELNHDELVKDFNDTSDEFNAQRDSFDKEIEESFGDLDFSLGEVE